MATLPRKPLSLVLETGRRGWTLTADYVYVSRDRVLWS